MAQRISSKDNFIAKRIKQLESKKYREKYGEFVIEGPTQVAEALGENIEIDFAVYSDSFSEHLRPESDDFLEMLEDEGIRLYCAEDRLFSLLSGTQTPQGLMAVVRKPSWDRSVLGEEGSNILVLDRVSDPGNMGTMLRTAEAAGFSAVVTIKGTTDPYSGKVSRASAGALMRLPVFQVEGPEELGLLMKSCGKRTVCTDPLSTVSCFTADIARNTAVIIGNEAGGVSEEILKSADIAVGIPMEGKTESLNAAVAAAILMYESYRQRLEAVR